MTREPHETPSARREAVPRPYACALWWTTVVWTVVVVVAISPRLLGAESLTDFSGINALIIAVASLSISFAALLPSWWVQWDDLREKGANPREIGGPSLGMEQRQTGLLVVGVLIRLLGTVALFLTCRYQMATPTEAVAAMTIGWYVLLTFVEVLVLARELPKPTGGKLDSASSERPECPSPIKV